MGITQENRGTKRTRSRVTGEEEEIKDFVAVLGQEYTRGGRIQGKESSLWPSWNSSTERSSWIFPAGRSSKISPTGRPS